MSSSKIRFGTLAAGLAKVLAASTLVVQDPTLHALIPPKVAAVILLAGTVYQTFAKPVVRADAPTTVP